MRRIGSISEYQVNLRWQVLHQEGHRLVQLDRTDQVVVVKYQDHLTGALGQVVEQRRHHRFQRLGRSQPDQRADPGVGNHRSHGGDDIGPEQSRVVVTDVEGQPRRRAAFVHIAGETLGQQGRLPEPGRR